MSKKFIRPDEYFNNGIVEYARFGQMVSMRNHLSPEDRRKLMNSLSDDYEKRRTEINEKVIHIREKVGHCDPVELLCFSAAEALSTMIGKTSESDSTMDEAIAGRSTEYLQSVLVSSENHFGSSNEQREDPTPVFNDIMNDIQQLYSMVDHFYLYWAAHVQKMRPDLDEDLVKYIVEAQVSFSIRGDRYQIHQIEHLSRLLVPHDEILTELFNVSSEELINGLRKLEYSLSQGKGDAFNELTDAYQEYQDAITKGAVWQSNISQDLGERVFGISLNNVALMTGWSEKLIRCLSYDLNSCPEFYSNSDFPGWPILHLPIQDKPFICVRGVSYCFDYYALFDNIYRVLQKAIVRLKPEYKSRWNDIQKVASETMVEDLFKKLLPGCNAYRDNYYYPNSPSQKDRAENDILVVYDNVLLIAEVKAGSFAYTPPITDYEAHINSFQALVEKPDHQCERIRKFIVSRDKAPIYDSSGSLKLILGKSEIDQIYAFSVTIDDFNVFAGKADKLSFIHLRSNAISISVNDLRTYSDYFTSPLQFLHFLKQRQTATTVPNIAFNDELDHLGMYIEFNAYCSRASQIDPKAPIQWYGYRKRLDDYFCSLNHPELDVKKPEQDVPSRIREIIVILENSRVPNRVSLSSGLLDLTFGQRVELSNQIDHLLTYQKEIGRMVPLYGAAPFRYCIFAHQPGTYPLSEDARSDYVDSTLAYNQEPDRTSLDLYYNDSGNLEAVDFRLFLPAEIRPARYAELREQGRRNAFSRVDNYKRQTGTTKIGRNEPCPCGSGKKFKRCCGR
jgi:hypothetical protein